jgi:quinoprotein glucose dehydrogenase
VNLGFGFSGHYSCFLFSTFTAPSNPRSERIPAMIPADWIGTLFGTNPGLTLHTPDAHRDALGRFRIAPEKAGPASLELKCTIDGYNRFLDPEGYPAVVPPWGTPNAIDLNKGGIVWRIPLGEHPELAAKGLRETGSWNYGGPIVTAGGVVFIGATNYDKKFRAFDKTTGKLLWETGLPAAGNATPMTYQIGGRQFAVIAAGGGKRGGESGGKYVAFALPRNK